MITLYTFGPALGLPDLSPFVIKAELLLKMSGLPYQAKRGGFRGAPKGKLPYIDDNGRKVADSTLIRHYLEQQYRHDFDAGHGPVERAQGWTVERMLEDHLYFALVHARWMLDVNFERGPRRLIEKMAGAAAPLVAAMARRNVRKLLHSQGMGRHSEAEIVEFAKRDLDALSTLLGDKPYLLGNEPSGADATMYAFVASVLCREFESPIHVHADRHTNLRDYNERMRQRFYPD
jgi:glutathione S-transferase